MATNSPICGLCEGLDLSRPSTVWCIECDKPLCSDCDKRHKLVNETKSHHTIPIEQYRQLPPEILKISQTCLEHNERLSTYCEVHEQACCIKCTLKKHNECKDILPLDEVVGGVKVSNALEECQAKLAENKENIRLVIKDRQQNLSQLKDQREKIQYEIRETRRKVNAHLDKIEKQLIQELTILEESHTAKYQTLISTLEEKEKQIEKMSETLSTIKDHATDLQFFLEMKKIDKLSEDEYIGKLISDGELNNTTLSVELSQTLRDIEKSIMTFGHVSMKSSPCIIVLSTKKDKEAQIHVPNVKYIENIGLDLIRSIDLKKSFLYGCCYLPDGRYAVVCNKDQCIVVMTVDGTVDHKIDVKPYSIIDITHIPSTNTLAATCGTGEGSSINIIDIDTRKITGSIKSDSFIGGITYKDGNLIFCAVSVGICKINLKDGETTTIKSIKNMPMLSYIASHRDNLYYTNFADTVACCSMDGTTRWEFKDEKVLRCPSGISVDSYGNIFVLGFSSSNLVVLTPDGSRHSEMLSLKDGLSYPVALDFDDIHCRIFLTNNTQKAFLYKLKCM